MFIIVLFELFVNWNMLFPGKAVMGTIDTASLVPAAAEKAP
jgi:hypothetical protein